MGTVFGKFRGIVTSVDDPLLIGRIKAKVPDVTGERESGWALPCAPYGGTRMGFFCLPAVGANVWIEFERGDPDYPVWAGSFWSTPADVPPAVNVPEPHKKIVFQSNGGHRIVIDDSPRGGISLETNDGMRITIGPGGIMLDNGSGASIELRGPTVSVNAGALTVT